MVQQQWRPRAEELPERSAAVKAVQLALSPLSPLSPLLVLPLMPGWALAKGHLKGLVVSQNGQVQVHEWALLRPLKQRSLLRKLPGLPLLGPLPGLLRMLAALMALAAKPQLAAGERLPLPAAVVAALQCRHPSKEVWEPAQVVIRVPTEVLARLSTPVDAPALVKEPLALALALALALVLLAAHLRQQQ